MYNDYDWGNRRRRITVGRPRGNIPACDQGQALRHRTGVTHWPVVTVVTTYRAQVNPVPSKKSGTVKLG